MSALLASLDELCRLDLSFLLRVIPRCNAVAYRFGEALCLYGCLVFVRAVMFSGTYLGVVRPARNEIIREPCQPTNRCIESGQLGPRTGLGYNWR